MTNAINPTPMAGGLARDGRTRRPVKVVEHPAFRGRGTRRLGTARAGHPGALRVVSLHPEAGTDAVPRVATTSTHAIPSILEAV